MEYTGSFGRRGEGLWWYRNEDPCPRLIEFQDPLFFVPAGAFQLFITLQMGFVDYSCQYA
jgi:hypothetical protein